MKHRNQFLRNSATFVSLMLLTCAVVSAQIDFRRPGGMKDRVVTPPPSPQQGPPVRYEPSAETKNLMEGESIRDVKEKAGENDALIEFRARASVIPVVEFGAERPRSGLGGQLEFPQRYGQVNAEVIFDKNALAQTNYKATLSGLDRGTRYYYLITVPGSNGTGTRQIQGRFTTVNTSTYVTVVFTEIEVTNDSDPGGNGELIFDFFVNGSRKNKYGNITETLSWNDVDPPRRINEVSKKTDAADTLDLAVNGLDEDCDICTPGNWGPFQSPWDDGDYEANVAKRSFNLNDYPGDYRRVDFELTSMSQSAGQGDLSFKVKGYFEIRRERAN